MKYVSNVWSLNKQMRKSVCALWLVFSLAKIQAQNIQKTMLRLPDTGENTSYTTTFGEDNDYNIHSPIFTNNGNGTVTDTVTGLMWQRSDGGEKTIENAAIYCDTLTLAGFTDWRLPNAHEAFSILNHQRTNPALDIAVFPISGAEYWWTSNRQSNDITKIWCTNAGGGIGNHPKSETISAGGTKKFHVRAVRDKTLPPTLPNHFTDNGDGTITDHLTNLSWQKTPSSIALTWEQALINAENFSLAGFDDWRLPNIKELQSINDETKTGPSVSSLFGITAGQKYWSSTTLPNQTTKAWYWQTQFGITTYDVKTASNLAIFVRGNTGTITEIVKSVSPEGIRIFPNPCSSQLSIQCNITGPAELVITDVLGKVFLRKTMEGGTREIQFFTGQLPSGLYTITLIENQKAKMVRLVVVQ